MRLPRLYRSLTAEVEMVRVNGRVYARSIEGASWSGKEWAIRENPHRAGTDKYHFWNGCAENCLKGRKCPQRCDDWRILREEREAMELLRHKRAVRRYETRAIKNLREAQPESTAVRGKGLEGGL